VRDTLLANPHYVFRHATAAATTQAATLHVRIGALDIGADVAIEFLGIEYDDAFDRPESRLTLEWQAAKTPALFPSMKATLAVFALSPTETRLELEGQYRVPMGKVGEWLDAAVGHRIAEASVTRFVQEVAGWLREELMTSTAIDEATPASRFDPVIDTD
jgi:hypothetical protein